MKFFTPQIITTTLVKDKAITQPKMSDDQIPRAVQGGLTAHFYDDTTPGAGTAKGPVKNVSVQGPFDWTSAVIPGGFTQTIGSDNITMRAFGFIEFPQENATYTFYVTTDDGARLYVGGIAVMNSWISQGATTYSGTFAVNTGTNRRRAFHLEWFNGSGASRLKLEWECAAIGLTRQVVPASAMYYETPMWYPFGVQSTVATVGVPIVSYNGGAANYDVSYGGGFRKIANRVELTGLIIPVASAQNLLFPGDYSASGINVSRLYSPWAASSSTAPYMVDMRLTGRTLDMGALPTGTTWVSLAGINWTVPATELSA
jgi:hypothetical protein